MNVRPNRRREPAADSWTTLSDHELTNIDIYVFYV